MATGGGGGFAGAVPFIGLGLQALGAGASIIQGIRARREQREAEAQAERALESAKRTLAVNRMEGLQVPLEAYELAERGLTAQQMQSTQALAEADARSLAAGVGRSQLVAQQGQEEMRQQMAQDIFSRDKMIAQEQSDIDRSLAAISLQEAEGAQRAAAQREQMAQQGFTGAVSGLSSGLQTFYENTQLYGSGRQDELKAAETLQKQGQFQDINARQARREMLSSGMYSPQELGNLAKGLTPSGGVYNPNANMFSAISAYNQNQMMGNSMFPGIGAGLDLFNPLIRQQAVNQFNTALNKGL
jgi:hypothetical protein